ncbi:PulJ/GspJ family protein [Fervidibacillus halotolerans]|uniref:Prepilin-type N-terminal cleavage/methylation domain-containing protein n=1 Tax=Fervidibacillus halotolerans TaxID=2980027 RepID=A0A9E8M0Q1_9BACI|nr:prepilin-type N-terminal cleavage/methylation domain-containing protein [Fervidibacillus halotolerans]WAA12847.1 prepilin-type N-terminal cleavage/methylation domain-containing protein [Fervidibacillus halotolerans]
MKRKSKHLHLEKGLTLVELLATITIFSIVGTIVYAVLFNGIHSYERTMEETKLRDEADYIMSNLIEQFFTLKASDVIEMPNLAKGQGYLKVRDKGEEKIYGFKEGTLYIDNEEVKLLNPDVQITDESTMIPMSETEFMVKLVLKMKDSEKSMELTSVINIIDDGRGEN